MLEIVCERCDRLIERYGAGMGAATAHRRRRFVPRIRATTMLGSLGGFSGGSGLPLAGAGALVLGLPFAMQR